MKNCWKILYLKSKVYYSKVPPHSKGLIKRLYVLLFRDIKQYAKPNYPRVVGILQTYIDCIPTTGPFYRRALGPKDGRSLRFSEQKIGVHTIQKMFADMCRQAGLEGRFTGHSGKVNKLFKLLCGNNVGVWV